MNLSRRTPEPIVDPPVHPRAPRNEAELIAQRLAAVVERRRARAAVTGARHSGRLLGNLLLTRGFLVQAELDFALRRQESTGDPIGRILVDLGLITDRDLVELLAEQLRMQVADLSRSEGDPSLLARLPRSEALRRAALPLRRAGDVIEVAVAEPADDRAVGELAEILGGPLRLLLAPHAEIAAAAARFYG